MIKKFIDFITEDASTTASPGSGQAVGGGTSGNFVSSAGTAVYGGDSGTAFATNSNSGGMGPIVSAQPSSKPGDVAGSTVGSGDIGSPLATYTKPPMKNKIKKKKYKKRAKKLDILTVQKFSDIYK